ncbi:hypothetical protein R3P38DRAFT_3008277 [Favolaschia claudopus]|uniref:Uncharacterized protein n=1 Tax=Favolaschia claudopus TaxID=2862362 RepID=A0AAW0AJP4_9AGAR
MANRRRRRVDSDSEPSTPERRHALSDILNLTQQLTPSKSPGRVDELRASLQSLANAAAEADSAKDRQIADLENQALPRPPRKRRKRLNRHEGADDSLPNAASLEERVREAGRHFAVEEALFLVNEVDTWDPDREEVTFEPEEEYEEEEYRVQSQVEDILDLLPPDARPLRTEGWIADSFLDGLNSQRSTMANRMRHGSAQHLVSDADRVSLDDTSSARFQAFKDRIGYVEESDTEAAHYSAFKAPILYDEFNGDIDVHHIFRNPLLLKIYASAIRGEHGAKGLFSDKGPYLPRANTIAKIHRITRTSTGAIANSAILALWMFSADTDFTLCGDQTGINYAKRYEEYVKQLREGLRKKKSWALELFKHWDNVLFPNSDDSLGQSAAGNSAAEQQERDEAAAAFNSAASRHSSPSDGDNDHGDHNRSSPASQASSQAGASHQDGVSPQAHSSRSTARPRRRAHRRR